MLDLTQIVSYNIHKLCQWWCLMENNKEKSVKTEKMFACMPELVRYFQGLERKIRYYNRYQWKEEGVTKEKLLKNYAKYLELDADYVLKLYQNKLIQEAPIPQDLLAKKKIPTFFFTVIIPIFVVAVFAIVTFVF